MSTPNIYLIAYDISCPKRWRKTQKALRKFCEREQLSVFLCRATPHRILKLEAQLKKILSEEDRLMIANLGPPVKALDHISQQNSYSNIIKLDSMVIS
jgi:CRISPR-associated protein Cas2